MRVSIPKIYRRSYNSFFELEEKNISWQDAACIQHVAIQALRAAFGWGCIAPPCVESPSGWPLGWDKENYNTLLREESRRIPKGMSWEEYKKVSRSGSRYRLDRMTRATIYAVVFTTRILRQR
jgi:hypothetical protein